MADLEHWAQPGTPEMPPAWRRQNRAICTCIPYTTRARASSDTPPPFAQGRNTQVSVSFALPCHLWDRILVLLMSSQDTHFPQPFSQLAPPAFVSTTAQLTRGKNDLLLLCRAVSPSRPRQLVVPVQSHPADKHSLPACSGLPLSAMFALPHNTAGPMASSSQD